ncbi:hypothetical protein [Butyrivibrio sp. XPD2006]|uniref:hypothetical protein n=1 Tax=Butyrivibrio sp. XPD2006 TaxID=1280668 RepID=UPI0003B310D4|nr:hypothetical protein [Butyrivibrio sp. XPD2006]
MKKKKTSYTMRSSLRTISVKCYAEQLGLPETATYLDIIHKIQKIIPFISRDFIVFAIVHYKDTLGDNIWLPANEKPHVHIWAKKRDNQPIHISQWLSLFDVTYRKDIDDDLFKNHGVEPCKTMIGCAMYATHDTEEAIKDGKEQYDISEVIMNISLDEFLSLRKGYEQGLSTGKLSLEQLVVLDDAAFQLGYELKDWEEWYGNLSFAQRKLTSMKTIKESYYRGLHKRYNENRYINRLSIFIQGAPGIGKSFYSDNLPHSLAVTSGKTGKYDDLQPSTEVISISDYTSEALLSMADNYICRAYVRNKNNAYWCGKLFVVTSNVSFEEWVRDCGGNPENSAFIDRFYVCHVDAEGHLICTHASKRGTSEEQKERLERFLEFKKGFEASLKQFADKKANDKPVDYSAILNEVEVKEKTDVEKEYLERENTELKDKVKEAEKRIIEAYDDAAKELLSLPLIDIKFLQDNKLSYPVPFMPSDDGKSLKWEIV